MFIWSAQQALGEFERQQPAIYQPLQRIQAAFHSDHYQKTIQDVWGDMPRISLDFAVMEHAQRMAMIPIDIGWSDIGSWAAVYDEQATHPGANVTQGVGRYIDIDTRGSLINSDRLVVTIGLDDIVIVDTDDVLLVCRRDCAQDVKLAVKQLEDKGLDKYL
jgi:mannose-1-phosphate guanylyltransferase